MRSKEVHLLHRPTGLATEGDFAVRSIEVDDNADLIVRNEQFSVDPYMRGRMIDRKSYLPPFELNRPMLGAAVGKVVRSRVPEFVVGDYVTTMLGWREYATGRASDFQKIDVSLGSPSTFLNALGTPGLTAWTGLFKVANLKQGETVFVSAAAGAVGSIACQLAKTRGCRVIGSAGSSDKCEWLTEVAGVDSAINYKSGNLQTALAENAPGGIDVYFENVGGTHLEAALDNMKTSGRIAVCGMIEHYNDIEPRPGPRNLSLIIQKTIRMEGFLVSRYFEHFFDYRQEMSALVRDGKIHVAETVVSGIEKAPKAFLSLFSGAKMGKILVTI